MAVGNNGMSLFDLCVSHNKPSLCVDMRDQFVYDPLISKRQQYLLATQVGLLHLMLI